MTQVFVWQERRKADRRVAKAFAASRMMGGRRLVAWVGAARDPEGVAVFRHSTF